MATAPAQAGRKFIDCSEFPSEKDCTLKISGTEDEVLEAATAHAVSTHVMKTLPNSASSFAECLRKSEE